MVDPLPTGKTTTPPIASFLESYLGNTIYVYRDAVLDFFDFLAGIDRPFILHLPAEAL